MDSTARVVAARAPSARLHLPQVRSTAPPPEVLRPSRQLAAVTLWGARQPGLLRSPAWRSAQRQRQARYQPGALQLEEQAGRSPERGGPRLTAPPNRPHREAALHPETSPPPEVSSRAGMNRVGMNRVGMNRAGMSAPVRLQPAAALLHAVKQPHAAAPQRVAKPPHGVERQREGEVKSRLEPPLEGSTRGAPGPLGGAQVAERLVQRAPLKRPQWVRQTPPRVVLRAARLGSHG